MNAARAGTRVPNVLSIAGSDPSGGAGIQADLKSIAACGGYGMAAITALTVQNTRGVAGVHTPPASFLAAQLESVSSDIRIDAVKIGMLADAEVIRTVGAWLEKLRATQDDARGRSAVVLDPVLVATSGDRLLGKDSEEALRALLPLADVVTPNLPELAALCGRETATTWDEALRQAAELSSSFGVLVLAKGGHLGGAECPDALVGPDGAVAEFSADRVDTENTHGTGCTLSSALATLFARTGDWSVALRLAKDWLRGALETADALEVGGLAGGRGHGPVNHFSALWSGAGVPRRDALTEAWWEDIADLRTTIDALGFIRDLRDGSLPREDFEYYLAQDALYLQTYGRVLSTASAQAPGLAEQAFWAESAHGCMASELELHRARLDLAGGQLPEVAPSPTTTGYLNHLVASATSYPVLVAALLPCFWLYQDIGSRLAAASHDAHPYKDWLAMYSSPEFDESTRRAIAWVEAAARTASPQELASMRTAFRESSRWELEFFDQRAPQERQGSLAPQESLAPGSAG